MLELITKKRRWLSGKGAWCWVEGSGFDPRSQQIFFISLSCNRSNASSLLVTTIHASKIIRSMAKIQGAAYTWSNAPYVIPKVSEFKA